MKWLICIVSLLVLGCSHAYHPQAESQLEREERWRKEIPQIIAARCTNELVGFYRVIDSAVMDSGSPSNWSAEVTAEYINKMGGVERTNLPFKFETLTELHSTNQFLHGYVDGVELLNRRMKAL